MSSRRARPPLFAAAAAIILWLGATTSTAHAELRSDGPLLAVGFSEKLRKDLTLPTIGWRWQLGAGNTLEHWASRIGADLSFMIEPSVAGILGDEESIEAQVVPLVHVEPLAIPTWTPYLEAGVGVIYTAVEDLRLGSNFLFSDNAGLGISMEIPPLWRWTRLSLGYRYRHISHAGIFGDPNSGMNTHYLVLTLR